MITDTSPLSGYLLGEHLSHTFSPRIHSLLADYSYGIIEIPKDDLKSFMTSGKFDFLNVTIPYKKEVIPYLSDLSEESKKIGAVNTVKRTPNGCLVGYNTDYYGFDYTLKKSGISVKGAKVLVLGSGGASVTVKAVLEDRGAKQIVVISRSGKDNYENISKHKDADIIVNTTPVGMYPHNGEKPIDPGLFPNCRGVIDIIYNPLKTSLLLDAEKLGIKNIGGLSMLVAQAKRAAEIFTDTMIHDAKIEEIMNVISSEMSNVILVGMPGCGKSTIGNIVAKLSGKTFVDCDEEFENKFGISPAEAIKTLGEAKFRQMEHEVTLEIGKLTGCVIATGGGVVTRKENYDPLHQNGKIFFIERPIELLAIDGRPISQSRGTAELYSERLPLYLKFSDHTVENQDAENTAKTIIEIMKAGTKQ